MLITLLIVFHLFTQKAEKLYFMPIINYRKLL